MSTNIVRAGAIADALLDRAATAGEKTSLADAFVAHWPIPGVPSPTNEQKAYVVVSQLKKFCKAIIEAEKRKTETAAVQGAVDSNTAAAVAHLTDEAVP